MSKSKPGPRPISENRNYKKGNIIRKIMQILIVISLLAMLLGNSAPAMAQDEVTVSITAPAEVESLSAFTARVDITGVADFDAGQFDISSDNSVIQLQNVTAGLVGTADIPVDIWNEVSPGKYRIIVNVPGVLGVSGSGYLAVLHFHVIGSAGSSSEIGLSNGFLNDNLAEEITATWTGGSVTVREAASSDLWIIVVVALGVVIVGLIAYFWARRRFYI